MKQPLQIFSTVLRALIGFGLLFYLARSGAIDWSAFSGLLEHWLISLAALVLLLTIAFLASWRFWYLLKPIGVRLPLFTAIKITLTGFFFSVFLPGTSGGDLVRIYYTSRLKRGMLTETATVILIDRMFSIFALLLMPVLVAPFSVGLLASVKSLQILLWTSTAVAILIPASLFLFSKELVRNSRIFSTGSKSTKIRSYLDRILNTLSNYRDHQSILRNAVIISFSIQAILVVVMLLLIEATNQAGVVHDMIILIPFGLMANALPFTPGGLGVGELAFDNLFALAGLTGGVEALVAWRILTTLIDLSGLVFFIQGRLSNQPSSVAEVSHQMPHE